MWPSATPSAPLVFSDASIRRYAFAADPRLRHRKVQIDGPVGRDSLVVVGDETAHDASGEAPSSGAVYLMRLTATGQLELASRIATASEGTNSSVSGSSLTLKAFDWFGCSVLRVSDLDKDGIPELIVGARGDDAGASDGGAVYVLFLDGKANVRSHTKLTHNAAGGLFGSSLAAHPSMAHDDFYSPMASDLPTLFVGAPGEANHQGSVYLLFLQADGTVSTTMQLSPSSWGASGPSLAAQARFGSSIAAHNVHRMKDDDVSYELSIGAPGVEHEAGAVILLQMGKRTVHSHSRLSAPHGQHQSGFGSFVTYGADVDGDGVREMIAGTTNGGLYSVFTGTNRSGVRRWMRKIQEPSSASSSSSTLLPTVGARPVALQQHGPHERFAALLARS